MSPATPPGGFREADLLVVGAGPAGLAAAREASSLGARVLVVDDNLRPGGQYLREPPPVFRRRGRSVLPRHRLAGALLAAVEAPRVEYCPDTVVWDCPAPGVLACAGPWQGRVAARTVILATGAAERAVPFPGWTLPGVLGAGGVLNLLKGQRVVPGGRVVVAGNGPLLLAVADALLRAGVEVAAVAEAAPIAGRALGCLPGLAAAPGLLGLGLAIRARIWRRGVALLAGWTVAAAEGRGALEWVRLVPVDDEHRRRGDLYRDLRVDALVVGFGLSPATELARLAGCSVAYDRGCGQWLPIRGPDLETSVPGIYAAGDGAAVGGVEVAILEGRLAARRAVARLEDQAAAPDPVAAALVRRLARFGRFRRALERLYELPAGPPALAGDDTVLCRCEDVTLGMVRARLAAGATTLTRLKGETRLGMGRCQGRGCLANAAALLAESRGVGADAVGWPRVRPPARPVAIGRLMSEPLADPELPADPHLPRERS